jgi:hypothetical protein
MTGPSLLTLLSVLLGGGFITSIVQALRARPDRDAVVIVPWQQLNTALREQNDDLRADWAREREARIESEGRLFLAEQRLDRLEAQLRAAGMIPHDRSPQVE